MIQVDLGPLKNRPILDVSQIAPKLYQGSFPDPAKRIERAGFQTLVLTAAELQPDARAYGSAVEVLRCRLADNPEGPTRYEWNAILTVAAAIDRRLRGGRRILVTCAQGRNRSGIVMAVVLHRLYNWSGEKCVRWIQSRRQDSLTNPGFVAALTKLR